MSKRVLLIVAVCALLGPVQHASAATRTFFALHRYTNTNSYLTINKQDLWTGALLAQIGVRAGSGVSTDECAIGYGWLPGGWYDIVGHFNYYDGSAIKGRVWQLSDKRCAGGTGNLRTELFIHSEETADEGQYCPTAYDDSFCWEGDFDYYSRGCVKVSHVPPWPSDIARMNNAWDNWDGRHGYFTAATAVFVS